MIWLDRYFYYPHFIGNKTETFIYMTIQLCFMLIIEIDSLAFSMSKTDEHPCLCDTCSVVRKSLE